MSLKCKNFNFRLYPEVPEDAALLRWLGSLPSRRSGGGKLGMVKSVLFDYAVTQGFYPDTDVDDIVKTPRVIKAQSPLRKMRKTQEAKRESSYTVTDDLYGVEETITPPVAQEDQESIDPSESGKMFSKEKISSIEASIERASEDDELSHKQRLKLLAKSMTEVFNVDG